MNLQHLNNTLTRRQMVRRSLSSSAMVLLPSALARAQSNDDLESQAGLVKARKRLAQRPRPLILDDDGDISL